MADPARRAAKNARTREWKVSNPDKHRAANQRRRATKAAAQVEDFTRADLLAYWDEIGSYGCVFCGGPYEHDEHIQPLSLGGEHSRANLLPSCATCNSSKGASDPIDYVNQRYGLRLSWPTERL
ncbi:HNH endonuclease [Streptomyces sp. NPDC002619]|uniref:HNH endonuclease n=1 Tax=Streptomyces sp. NPDC002619 TaxID=3364655 RepID=UPI0036A035C5